MLWRLACLEQANRRVEAEPEHRSAWFVQHAEMLLDVAWFLRIPYPNVPFDGPIAGHPRVRRRMPVEWMELATADLERRAPRPTATQVWRQLVEEAGEEPGRVPWRA